MGKIKQPKIKRSPDTGKHPKIRENPQSYLRAHPSWRLGRLEFVEPFGWHVVDANMLTYIRRKLAEFETMTWDEIQLGAKKQNHSVATESLSKEARERLESLGLDELEDLFSLRLSGSERIWGILDRGVVTLLWWDPDHRVCPSVLRYT